MNMHLQVIRDLRKRLQEDPLSNIAYETVLGRQPEGGIAVVRRLQLIEALKHCEYLLEVGDCVHSERAQ